MIAVPQPGPDEVIMAIRDAGGACSWVTVRKSDLHDGPLLMSLLAILEDAQRVLREQKAGGHDLQPAS